MNTVQLSDTTYQWLKRKAIEKSQTPDQMADTLLQQQLAPKHAYIEVVEKIGGSRSVIKGTNIPVSLVIGYLRLGETPETLTNEVLPHLTLAQIHDALSYYYDHQYEIDQELAENTEERGRTYLREHLGEKDYLKITGQTK